MTAGAFVGRVGELAVALGVGAAVCTGTAVFASAGTAWADSPSESSDFAPASASSPSDSGDAETPSPTTNSSPNAATPSAVTDAPTSTVSASTVTVRADDTETDTDTDVADESNAEDEPAATPKTKKSPAAVAEPSSTPRSKLSADEVQTAASAASVTDVTGVTDEPVATTQRSAAVTTAATVAAQRSPEPVVPSLRPWPTAFDPITAVTYVTGLVSSVVNALLSPFAAGAPALPSDPSPWALLAWVRRELFDSSPTVTTRPQTQSLGLDGDVVVRGNVGAADADGDALSYTLVGRPLNGGTVSVDANGDFTYRPMNAMAAVGGTDQFTVVVSDEAAGFHLHGPMGLLQFVPILGSFLDPGAGHRVATTVTVTVTPVDGVDLSLPAGVSPMPGSRPREGRVRRSTPTPTGTGGCTIRSTSSSASPTACPRTVPGPTSPTTPMPRWRATTWG